jgi:hypothetical protein
MARKSTSKAANGRPVLARPGDPLLTADGREIEPTARPGESDDRPTKLNPKTFRPVKKRSIHELPAPINVVNAVSCVFMYTMLGLGEREIIDALKITQAELKQLRNHPAYAECFNAVLGEFINSNSDLLAARIAAYSHTALDTVAGIAQNAKKDEVRLTASRDLLDRAGVTAKNNQDRANSNGLDTLKIVVVKGNDETEVNVSINGGT